jgi:hypothetical protein
MLFLVGAGPFGFADVGGNLEKGFQTGFADPDQFRLTDLFGVLGYSPAQIKQIVGVTPRPASLSVGFVESPDSPGGFVSLTVTAHQVRYYNLTIDHAVFSFADVQLDPEALNQGMIRFRRVGEVGVETNVSSGDILKVFDLVTKARHLSDLRLKINSKETVLSGTVRKGILRVEFSIQGKPELSGAKRVDFRCRRMALNGQKLPRSAVNAAFSRINPVFDAKKTWLNLELQSIELLSGFVRTKGLIKPALPPTPVLPVPPPPSPPSGIAPQGG